MELRIGEGHAADPLVLAGRDGDSLVRHLENGVSGNQRRGVAVRAEAQVREVQRLRQGGRVAVGGGVQILVGDRHRPDAALSADREALHQVGQVALVGAGRSHSLVDLEDLDLPPIEVELLELGEHRPRIVAAAHGEREVAALRDVRPSSLGDHLSAAAVDGVGVLEDLEAVGAHRYFGFSWCPPNW